MAILIHVENNGAMEFGLFEGGEKSEDGNVGAVWASKILSM